MLREVSRGVQVLEEGALQPVIGLLSSSCTESQRESALLLGQFATTDHEFKAKIVQRGAVPPLITMLGSSDVQLKEMAAFALGRLAQNVDNQAGIVQVLLARRPSPCLAEHAAGYVNVTLPLLSLRMWAALQSGFSLPLQSMHGTPQGLPLSVLTEDAWRSQLFTCARRREGCRLCWSSWRRATATCSTMRPSHCMGWRTTRTTSRP